MPTISLEKTSIHELRISSNLVTELLKSLDLIKWSELQTLKFFLWHVLAVKGMILTLLMPLPTHESKRFSGKLGNFTRIWRGVKTVIGKHPICQNHGTIRCENIECSNHSLLQQIIML